MDTGKIKIVNISQIKLTKINLAFNNTRNIVFSVKAHRIVIVSSDHRLCLVCSRRSGLRSLTQKQALCHPHIITGNDLINKLASITTHA